MLDRELSWWWLAAGWVVATGVYVAATSWVWPLTQGDATESVFAAWALAHGHVACGYLPAGVPGYGPTAPVYVLASGAVLAITRVGHAVPFPSGALGHSCATATAAIRSWATEAGAWTPTLRVGYLGWVLLVAGIVAVLRTTRRGRTSWEPLCVLAAAISPPVAMCLVEYFHPQDLCAVGFALACLACVRRDAWVLAGIAAALCVLSQQFGVLVVIPLLVIAPAPRRVRFIVATALTGIVVTAPLLVLTSGRAMASILVGTGESATYSSMLVETGLRGSALYAVARVLPMAVAAIVAWWAQDRLGDRVFDAVPLVSLLATSLVLRLVFDVELWGYYLMAATVMLIVLDVVRGRIRASLICWMALVVLAGYDGILVNDGRIRSIPAWLWQCVLSLGALWIAAAPLVRCGTAEPAAPDDAAVAASIQGG